MSKAGFWDNPETAQSVVSQLSGLKSVIEPAEQVQRSIKDLLELFELAEGESDRETLEQIEKDLAALVESASR